MSGRSYKFVEVECSTSAAESESIDATPPLCGPASVGMRQYWATDASRLDSSTGIRRFMTAVWYPAKPDPPAPRSGLRDLLFDSAEPALSLLAEKSERGDINLPAMHARLEELRFRAQRGLVATGGPHPVLIAYPAGECHRFVYAGICESLASSGYVVVALDAPRDAPLIVFPDGRLVTGPMGNKEDYIWPRVADIRFLLDQLPVLNAKGPLQGQLDLQRIGMFGSSRGGYLSNIMAVVDERIKAAVNKDGFLWGLWGGKNGTGLSHYPPEWQDLARQSQTPVLRLRSEQQSLNEIQASYALERKDFGGEFIYIAVKGYTHGSFAPTPWLCGPVEKCLNLEKDANLESQGLLTELLSGFFGEHLQNENADWLASLSQRSDLQIAP